MWEFEVHLSPRQRRKAAVYCVQVTDIAAHMVVSPALEGGPRVICVFAVDLNQFVKDAARQVQVLVSQVVAQNQREFYSRELVSRCGRGDGAATHLLNPVSVLVVPGDMSAISDQYIAAFY